MMCCAMRLFLRNKCCTCCTDINIIEDNRKKGLLHRSYPCATAPSLFYAGGGGLPRTERQPAGLIARPAGQGRAVRPAHTPQIKKETPPNCDMSPQYWVSSIGGTYQVLRAFFAYCSVCTRNSVSGAFNLFSDHAFQFLRDRCTICNTVIPEIRNTFALFHGQIAVDQKQAF